MTIAIMQPYIFPYIGYFQLINAADTFIIYDDVTYIKQGWINRNNILVNGKKTFFTVPLENAGSNRLICDIKVGELSQWRSKFFKTLDQNYKKAPYFKETFHVVESSFDAPYNTISDLCSNCVTHIVDYLDIKTEIINSSKVYNNNQLKSQDRIINICVQENADQYVNPIGGKHLYSKEDFMKYGIRLQFIRPQNIMYKQFKNDFVDSLSIIDMMMFNSSATISKYLISYDLV